MRALIIGLIIAAAGAAPGLAAKGDPVRVLKPGVNLRSAPVLQAEVLLTVGPGEAMVELTRKGDWLFVNLPDKHRRGWVHRSVVAGAADAPPGALDASPGAADASPDAADAPLEPPADSADAALGARPLLDNAPPPGTAIATEAADSSTVALAEPAPPSAPAGAGEPAAVGDFRTTVRDLNERAKALAGIDLFTDVRTRGGGEIDVLATAAWNTVPASGRESFTNALYDQWRIAAGDLSPLGLQILDPAGAVLMRRP